MRALALKPVAASPGERDHGACGRSLSSNYTPPNLENRVLLRSTLLTSAPPASLMLQHSSCSSLQPSPLSSTSSTLLLASSSPPAPSPLLSTQNRLLSGQSTNLCFSSFSSTLPPSGLLLATPTTDGALPASALQPEVGEKPEDDNDEEEKMVEKEMTSENSELDSDWSEEEEDAISTLESHDFENEDYDQDVSQRQEEFSELDRGKEEAEEALKDQKNLLLNTVCCSLINKKTSPGQKDWDSEDSVWTTIMKLAKDITDRDPQFLLKVAVYTRQELNVRITANFLLALAANLPATKSHVRRYYCAAVQLPSDWLEVARIYSTCFSRSLPMCLKKAMADKFKQFSEYQLAKYNTRKHRCKHNRNRRNKKKPTDEQLSQWANMLRSDPTILKKFLQVESRPTAVDKKQSEFSLKKMIKRLHIKEPAEHVMAVLGRKYPADAKSFIRSGLRGVWEQQRAGQRMKLKNPETWERLLSNQGNKAATWEQLIDNGSLPFMAMLRNLRNMIIQGISEQHHHKILHRLSNKKAVIQSRQFPFRFLAAYKVIMELRKMAKQSQQEVPPVKEILKGILKNIPKSNRFKRLDWDSAKTRRMRVALGVPFVYRIYNMKKAQLQKANQRNFTVELLDRYCRALDTAVQISCRYNIPPLPGRTLILVSARMSNDPDWSKKQDFCLPQDSEEENEETEDEQDDEGSRKKKKKENDPLTPSLTEMAVLLALMIGSRSEESLIYLYDWYRCGQVKLKSDVLLENVKTVKKQIQELQSGSSDEENSLYRLLTKNNKVDNILILSDSWVNNQVQWTINNYVKNINNKVFLMKVFTSPYFDDKMDKNCAVVTGLSEQLLRFVAERGSSRLLDHVECLDKIYKIPPPEGGKGPETTSGIVSLPASPKVSWRGVRVFISSTFRDMHTERDVLVRSVFPELRRRAMHHCIHLEEVDLRWGVTEEESNRATELCLSEVCRSQLLIGILGERYGLVPSQLDLPDLPQYSWVASAPAGLSVTELEIRQFQALDPDTVQERMFFYFRDPNFIKSVPVPWRSHFSPESHEAESKMSDLKSRILDSDVKVTQNYPCEWAGILEGAPHLKSLEGFAKAVLDDVWEALLKQFVQEDDRLDVASDLSEQDLHQGALQRRFFGRAKLLSAAVEIAERIRTKGGLMVVESAAGDGKTVFMAALAEALRTGEKSRSHQRCDVISYSTAASQAARSVDNLLRCLLQGVRMQRDSEEEKSPLPQSYREQMSEFHTKMSDVKKSRPLALLVDGADLVRDGSGQLNSDWIPQHLPQGVCLIISVTSSCALLQTLIKKRGATLFSLGPLTVSDRKDIVQKGLATFGKKLSDSAFNNQLQTLVMKKGAVSPLYLQLACEDLRNFATFDKLKDSVQRLPETLKQLVGSGLQTLCLQFRGHHGLHLALVALTVSTEGLRERDFYAVLDSCNSVVSPYDPMTWQNVLNHFRRPAASIPMATFTSLLQSLKSLIGRSHCCDPDDLLALTNPEIRRAFEDSLISEKSVRTRGHFILAAHQWAAADPQGTDTFSHCEASALKNLPTNLMKSDQQEALQFLLSNYYYLYANVRHGLLRHLLETYTLYNEKCDSVSSAPSQDGVTACWSFVRRHASLLSSCPALFIQQAFNEPHQTPAHSWARSLTARGGVRVIEWQNKEEEILVKNSELVSTFSSEPTSLVMSLNGELMVVGTEHGTLHFLDTKTGQEVKSLVSSCDGISSCVFLSDTRLAATSYDGRIELWDTENGCRTGLVDGHTNVITGSALSEDRKHLATASLDCTLKVWSSARAHETASALGPSPFNCVTFDPKGHLLAAGCWNGTVIMWNWLQDKIQSSLSGHRSSVRSVSFSSPSMLVSGCLSGEVRVWSVSTSTCVGCFQAHSGAAQALVSLDHGTLLLSAGSDHTLQLWSQGLGRSVITLKSDDCEPEPPQKKLKPVTSGPAALCAAVHEYAAVGYHAEGIKVFSTDSGEKIWASEDLGVSVLCLMWLSVAAELLVSGGGDKRLRLWKKNGGEDGILAGLVQVGEFGVQQGAIVALAQNSSYLASASDDFTIALWLVTDLTLDPWADPTVVSVLRGHSGGVTCLHFSPDGQQLLSGGKDQTLIVWDVSSSPAAPSKTLRHAHRDWITGCLWTPDCVLSCSNDGRICVWDLQAAQSLREMSSSSPLTSICCAGQYVIAGCAEGALHVWSWETQVEICHIPAHKQRVNHCSVVQNADTAEDMTVFTASDDGTVQLWKPLQVEHFSTFQAHSGGIHAVVPKEGFPEFLTVSEDRSLRRWLWKMPSPPSLRGAVSSLCFSQSGDLVVVGFDSGFLELWQNNCVVGQKQVSAFPVTAICCMPDGQFAVGCREPSVDVWKLVWNKHGNANLVKVLTYSVSDVMIHLIYCSALIGVSQSSAIYNVGYTEENKWNQMIHSWNENTQVLWLRHNDKKSLWLAGESEREVHLAFMVPMGPNVNLSQSFGSVQLSSNEPLEKRSVLTAVCADGELVVCGDIKGNMWFLQPPYTSSWSNKQTAHSSRISVLRVTSSTIISASHDGTVKLWDRNTKKQVGMFVCGSPVLVLEVNPQKATELVCGDEQGKVYFLTWRE